MNWLDEIATELRRVVPGENPGRTRTIARRAAGIAAQQWSGIRSADMMHLLRAMQQSSDIPSDVRSAIERLTARIDAEFRSPSEDPVADARIIVEYVRTRPMA